MIEVLTAGDPRRKVLDKLRDRIAVVEDKLAALEGAFLTVDEAVAGIMATTSDGVSALRLRVSQHCHPGVRGLSLVPEAVFGGGGDRPIYRSGGVDPLALTRFAMGEQAFEAMLRERVREFHPDADGAVPATERPERRAKLQAELDEQLEREEAEIIALEARGLLVDRRPLGHGDTAAVDRFLNALEIATSEQV